MGCKRLRLKLNIGVKCAGLRKTTESQVVPFAKAEV